MHLQVPGKRIPVLTTKLSPPSVALHRMSCRLYHDLSKGSHGSAACPRTIYEGGADGWSANEAAALSIIMEYNGFSYMYCLDDVEVHPPPYRPKYTD